jgi:hypothetical protein
MKPIFIGGCERSGTTLLGAMLGAHARHLCVPEMQFKFDILQLADRNGAQGYNKAALVKALARRSHFRLWELAIDVTTIAQESGSSRELIEWFVRLYGQKVDKPTPMLWLDHTPKNIRYAHTLFAAFPDARMIHIVRDGRAVAASVLPLDWGPNVIDSAARYWAERLAYGLAAEIRWPDKVIRVHYEDLVQRPEATLKILCERLTICYDPAMNQGQGFQVPRYTARQHALVGQAPDSTRVDMWRQQLTPRQIEIFEHVTGDLLQTVGYSLDFGLAARKATWKESLTASLQDLYQREFVNRRRKRQRKRATIPA